MTQRHDKPAAIVTGAAGDIGLATVRCLIRDGWAMCASSLEVTQDLLAVLRDEDLAIEADVTNEAEVDAMMVKARSKFGRLDGLVHCAGTSAVAKYHEQNSKDWSLFVDVNLSGAFYVSRAFTKECSQLPKADRSIVMISSLAAIAGGANPAYGASKAGVCALVYNMAQTYADIGVRANAVLPGVIDTQMVRSAFPDGKFEIMRKAASARTPAGRLGRPEDVAETCAFLLSDRASFITGQAINVTGGFELVPPIGNLK